MWWAIGKRWAQIVNLSLMKVATEQICTSSSFVNKTFSWCHHFLNRVQKLSYYPATGQYVTCSFLTSFYWLDKYRWHSAQHLHCNDLCKLIFTKTKTLVQCTNYLIFQFNRNFSAFTCKLRKKIIEKWNVHVQTWKEKFYKTKIIYCA